MNLWAPTRKRASRRGKNGGAREPQSEVGVTHDQQDGGTEHEDEDWRDVDEVRRGTVW